MAGPIIASGQLKKYFPTSHENVESEINLNFYMSLNRYSILIDYINTQFKNPTSSLWDISRKAVCNGNLNYLLTNKLIGVFGHFWGL